MRHAITLIRPHGEPHLRVVAGPDVPVNEQVSAFKDLTRSAERRQHPEIAEVQVWTSSNGCIKRAKFDAPTSADPVPSDDDAATALAAKANGAEPVSEVPAARKSKPKK
jgi:hypothetical protein